MTKVDFSPCGKYVAAVTNGGQLFTVDAFKGMLVANYSSTGHEGATPSFSPDSQFLACGNVSGSLHVYRSIALGDDPNRHSPVIARLDGHSSHPKRVLFNPVRCMIASACVNVALWIPRSM